MAEPNPSDALSHLAELERRAALRASSDTDRALSRQRFLARLDTELEPRRSWLWHLRWAAPAVVACAAALALWLRPPALTFDVQGAELSGKYVSAPAERSAELYFSDDSKVVAAAGSRLRVEDTSPRGARVLLERGRASVHVVHQASTAWSFSAGPFEVHVTGTRFDLSWDAAKETCELTLHEGSVEVRGPTGSGPVVVRAGQRFEGDAQRRTMQVLPQTSSVVPSATSPTPSSVEAAPEPSERATPTLPPPSSRVPAPPRAASWPTLIAQGKFQDVVSEAEAHGASSCLTSCSAADLRALSDAARYTGKTELARQSLLALRQRFPAGQGAEATFLLGRLDERRGSLGSALTWYDTYLREAPSGAFAAEALAGKLRAVKTTQGKKAAEPLAREYLQRFPKGVHVSTAREILGE